MMVGNTGSTADDNTRGRTIGLNSEENICDDRTKYETRKISQFILCDEEINEQGDRKHGIIECDND